MKTKYSIFHIYKENCNDSQIEILPSVFNEPQSKEKNFSYSS